MEERLYTISEVADKLGLATKTLRRWEETGKFTPQRTLGGQRRYSLTDLQILDAIKHGTITGSKDLLTIEAAAKLFGVTPATILRWEDSGKIHPLITTGITYYPRHRLVSKMEELQKLPRVEEPTTTFKSVPLDPVPSPSNLPRFTPPAAPPPPTKKALEKSKLGLDNLPPVLLNLMVTIIMIVVYHLIFNSQANTTTQEVVNDGSIQGVSQARDPALNLLDSILDKAGNLKPLSLTTSFLSLTPSAPPDKAVPGSLYFDAGSQSLKLFTNNWIELTKSSTYTLGDSELIAGNTILAKGQKSLTVNNPNLTSDSTVIVTFMSDISPASTYWITKQTGSFTVHLTESVANQIAIDYLIINPILNPETLEPTSPPSPTLESLTR